MIASSGLHMSKAKRDAADIERLSDEGKSTLNMTDQNKVWMMQYHCLLAALRNHNIELSNVIVFFCLMTEGKRFVHQIFPSGFDTGNKDC